MPQCWTRKAAAAGASLLGLGLPLSLSACGSGSGSPPHGQHAHLTDSGRHHTKGSKPASGGSSTTTSTTPAVVAGANGQVTVLEIGDSLGEDLGFGLQWAFSKDAKVHFVAAAVGDTGLANTNYYDWAAHLNTELHTYHPQVVVVFLGANDDQGFDVGSEVASVGSALWSSQYSKRVGILMSEATSAGARVLWVGMPIMESPSFSAHVVVENSIYSAEASSHQGATYYPSWPLFVTASGGFNGGDSSAS
ncbi:MAG: DUF459 domain-containing protein, partial [Acidimicrobiales bacterium]